MKKIIVSIILWSLICISLIGCIHWETSVTYELMYDISEIKSIRIYGSDFSEGVYDYSDRNDPCKELLSEIPSEEFALFAEELTALSFVESHMILLIPVTYGTNFYYGNYIIKVDYCDGSCELISDMIQRQFIANKQHPDVTKYQTTHESWLAFLQNWADISIININ